MKIYQVDAFTHEKFKGNPAAVCVLPDDFVSDSSAINKSWMQDLAAEMNLSETAFVKDTQDGAFSLQWFTPMTEVDLCGHATLATSHILWSEGYLDKDEPALFDTLSGRLTVVRIEADDKTEMMMNFPIDEVAPCDEPVGLEMALGCPVINVYSAGLDMMVEVADEKTVAQLNPVIQQLSVIPVRCIIVTARGNDVDFVSRVFGPAVGIDEDPVTGSTHCSLTPFWAERLGKNKMTAKQLSKRGGVLGVELMGDRVNVSGQAVTVFSGELS